MQFVVVGVVVALVLAWVTGILGERLAREQAIDDANATTQLIADTVVEPALSSGLLTTQPGVTPPVIDRPFTDAEVPALLAYLRKL